jgi:hypothetical protein
VVLILAASSWASVTAAASKDTQGIALGLERAIDRTLSSAAVRTTLRTKGVRSEELFRAPDRARWSERLNAPKDKTTTYIAIGGALYMTDLHDPARFVSCQLPTSSALKFTPTLRGLALLLSWGSSLGNSTRVGGRTSFVVDYGRAPKKFNFGDSRSTVVVEAGRVVSAAGIPVDGTSSRARFFYTRVPDITPPAASLVTARPHCLQTTGQIPLADQPTSR